MIVSPAGDNVPDLMLLLFKLIFFETIIFLLRLVGTKHSILLSLLSTTSNFCFQGGYTTNKLIAIISNVSL